MRLGDAAEGVTGSKQLSTEALRKSCASSDLAKQNTT
jgi:hypothetical protein